MKKIFAVVFFVLALTFALIAGAQLQTIPNANFDFAPIDFIYNETLANPIGTPAIYTATIRFPEANCYFLSIQKSAMDLETMADIVPLGCAGTN